MSAPAIRILAVPGTWARKRRTEVQWFDLLSPLHGYLTSRGFAWLRGDGGRAFEWTTDLNGHQFWRRWIPFLRWKPHYDDWEVGGVNLYAFLVPPLAAAARYPGNETVIWAHSHGIWPVMFACRDGLKVNTLVTFCSPVRADPELVPVLQAARNHIGHWIHVYSDEEDAVQIAGSAGDGVVDVIRHYALADSNIYTPGGHSGILTDPRLFWRLRPILDAIRSRYGQ